MSAKIICKSYNQNDSLLFPPSLGELIPENHPVRTVSVIIDKLDISGIESVANKYTFVWKGSVEKNKARLEAKVDAVLKTAESVLAGEDAECTKEEPCVEGLPKRTGRILRKMDGQGISDRKLRRSVKK